MQSRHALYLNVAIAAVATAGIVVGLTLDTRTTPHQPKAMAGKPPVPKNLPAPVRSQIVSAFRDWPHGSIDDMQRLGLEYAGGATPKERYTSAVVQYFRGVALLWAGYPSDAEQALEKAKSLGKNTMIHNQADSFLHSNYLQTGPPFYPVFQPIQPSTLLEQGARLQVQGHQVSAERLYQRAARLHPDDAEAQVAAAVGLFDEDNLTPAFSHLGPLVQRFPKSQSVHYYLGLLLAWTGQGSQAIGQFEKAVKLGSTTPIGKQAAKILEGIAGASDKAAAG
ncbi:MAG TPA: hypothetical protein VLV28_06700 [Gaiellaceae bacterium]|nr:hypothetical protein [Gaiellaceae bacterium]